MIFLIIRKLGLAFNDDVKLDDCDIFWCMHIDAFVLILVSLIEKIVVTLAVRVRSLIL